MEEDNNLTTPIDHTDVSKSDKSGAELYSPDPNSVDLSAVTPQSNVSDDISRILDEIKLPERRTFVAQGDTKQPTKEITPATEELPKNDLLEKNTVEPNTPTHSIVMPLRTLRNDLQDVVRDSKMSMVKAVSLEQDKRRVGSIDTAVIKKTNNRQRIWSVLFVIVVLFGLVTAALFGVYIITQQNKTPDTNQQTIRGILFAETTIGLPIDNTTPDSLKKELIQARDSSKGAVGSIMQIVPTTSTTTTDGTVQQSTVSLENFLKAMGTHPPDDLLRSLDTTFFFGIHSVDKNSPVFVIPVVSYDHAFADMLLWEPTMDADLSPLFTPVPVLKTDANGLPVNRTFTDVIMNNYDVRALKDDSGAVQLYYSFPRPNILVIAESPYTFTEVLSRLQAARKL